MSPWAQTPFQQSAGPAIHVVATGTQGPESTVLAVGSDAGSCMVTVPLPSWRNAIRRPATWMDQRSPGWSTSMLQLCQGPSPSRQRSGSGSAWTGASPIPKAARPTKALRPAGSRRLQLSAAGMSRHGATEGWRQVRSTEGWTGGSLQAGQSPGAGAIELPRFNKPPAPQVPVFRARVQVSLRPSVLDPAGEATRAAAARLGVDGVRRLRIGKAIELELEAADAASARSQIELLSDRLFANPVIEDWTLEMIEASGEQSA